MSDERKLPVTYTAEDVAKVTHLSVQTVRKLIKKGTIPGTKIGAKYIVTEETLQRILKGEIPTEDKGD